MRGSKYGQRWGAGGAVCACARVTAAGSRTEESPESLPEPQLSPGPRTRLLDLKHDKAIAQYCPYPST